MEKGKQSYLQNKAIYKKYSQNKNNLKSHNYLKNNYYLK